MDTISLTIQQIIRNDFFSTSKLNWKSILNKKHGLIRFLTFNNCHFQYFSKYRTLKLTFSATKLLYGNNLKDFDFKDLKVLYSILMNTIKKVFNFPIINVKYWNITRLDLVSNIIFKNNHDKKTYIETLKNFTYSRCKKNLYSSSLHAHNKSITLNFYDKNIQIKNSKEEKNHLSNDGLPNTLRMEIQFKNSLLNRLSKKFSFPKTFGAFMSSPSFLNKIYKDSIKKIGLDKNFLTIKEMSKFLKKLYKNKEIGIRKFNNMYNYFINKKITISKNTLADYKKILSKYNYSHIVLSSKVNKKINFLTSLIFKNSNNYLLFKTNLIDHLKKGDLIMTKSINYLLLRNLKKLIKIFDDS